MKKFTTHNETEINTTGTYLQGYINCSYFKLKKLFGKPTDADKYKIDAYWKIQFNNGEIATIYNYKDGKNYNGKNGLPISKIKDWHIGGFNFVVVSLINKICS